MKDFMNGFGIRKGTEYRLLFWFVRICCLCTLFGTFGTATAQGVGAVYRIKRVCIDAGHGGKDPGAVGKISKEKDVALKIALQLGTFIKSNMPNLEVFYTRTKDVYLTLHERALFANEKKADLFISVHCNWIGNPKIHGTETYVMGLHKSEDNFEVAKRENSVILLEENSKDIYHGFNPSSPDSYILFNLYQSAHHANSVNFAAKVESEFAKRLKKHSRGVKTAGFWVLWETSMPSVLIETGYLSNLREARKMNTKRQQKDIAWAILRAFKAYKKEVEN